jgi:hypothetical protein
MSKQKQADSVALNDARRRRLLLGLGSIVGAATASELLGGNAFSVAMAFTESTDAAKRSTKIFDSSQLATLGCICQTVIPATDTAGAGDVNTHGFIDNQLHYCFDQSAQDSIVKVVDLIEEKSKSRHKASFTLLSLANASLLLSDIDTSNNGFTKSHTGAFKFLKSLIVFGYYTSEVGASKQLTYDAVPGEFKGSIQVDDTVSAWGSLAYF